MSKLPVRKASSIIGIKRTDFESNNESFDHDNVQSKQEHRKLFKRRSSTMLSPGQHQ